MLGDVVELHRGSIEAGAWGSTVGDVLAACRCSQCETSWFCVTPVKSRVQCAACSLMLMAVYNVSINHKGFKYLRSKPSLITQLAWLVQSKYLSRSSVHFISPVC